MNEATSRLSYNTRYFSGTCALKTAFSPDRRRGLRASVPAFSEQARLFISAVLCPARLAGNYLVIVGVLAIYALCVPARHLCWMLSLSAYRD